MVDDQEKAFQFYTKLLGFETKHDIPMGKHRWITLTSPGDKNGVELALEPSEHPAVGPFRDAMVQDGIPWTSFAVDNLEKEHARLEKLGVQFTQPPVTQEGYSTAIFDDTCGNLIQIIQLP
jgi:predicted enzyme related to lactoylglutathione lyase